MRKPFVFSDRYLPAARIRRLAFGLAAAVLAAGTGTLDLAAQESPAQTGPTLRIASEGARPPYNFLNAESQLDGFEIELGRELCARMHATCTFVQQDWDGLIPNLKARQYDAILSAMEITDARQEKIAFTKAYLHMPSAFVSARRRQIRDASPETLAGRTIGVAADSPQQGYLEDNYPKSTIKTYEGNDDAILDLAEGRIDAMLGAKDALTDFLKTRYEAKCCKFLADLPRDPAFFGQGFGIGLRQQDTDLKAAFDAALDEITADGTYARISAKYFDFDVR